MFHHANEEGLDTWPADLMVNYCTISRGHYESFSNTNVSFIFCRFVFAVAKWSLNVSWSAYALTR